jgi:hypothetical protein
MLTLFGRGYSRWEDGRRKFDRMEGDTFGGDMSVMRNAAWWLRNWLWGGRIQARRTGGMTTLIHVAADGGYDALEGVSHQVLCSTSCQPVSVTRPLHNPIRLIF